MDDSRQGDPNVSPSKHLDENPLPDAKVQKLQPIKESGSITVNDASVPRKEDSATVPAYITEIGPNDVLLGRGVPFINNPGNVAFRELVRDRKAEYLGTGLHNVKDAIAREIIEVVARRNGRFLQRVQSDEEAEKLGVPKGVKAWIVADESKAIEKAKQSLRDKAPAKKINNDSSHAHNVSRRNVKTDPTHSRTAMKTGATLPDNEHIIRQYTASAPKHDDRIGHNYSFVNEELTNLEHVLRQNREQLLAQLIQQEQQQQRQQQQRWPPTNLLQSVLGNDTPNEFAYSLQQPIRTAAIDTETLLRRANSSAQLDLQQMLYQSGIPLVPNSSFSSLLPSGFAQNRIPNPVLTQPELLLQSLLSNRQQASAWNANIAGQFPDSLLAAQLDPRVLSRASLSNSLASLAAINSHDDKVPNTNQHEEKSRQSKVDNPDNVQCLSPPNKKGKSGPR